MIDVGFQGRNRKHTLREDNVIERPRWVLPEPRIRAYRRPGTNSRHHKRQDFEQEDQNPECDSD